MLIKDVRYIQIIFLASLFIYGLWMFDLSFRWMQVPLTLASGLLTQFFWIKKLNLKSHSFLSALISSLSIVLLLRSHNLWMHPLAAFIAIHSKFLLQYKGQHIFNPSALGIFAILLWNKAWISPGQWGSGISISAWVIAVGCLIAGQMRQSHTAWLFLIFYLGGVLIRNIYLGYEMAVFYHTALKGSFLIFAFFMISDPRSAPHHFMGQVVFSSFVAIAALTFHYYFFMENGLIYALMIGSCLVPFLNHYFQAPSFQWRRLTPSPLIKSF